MLGGGFSGNFPRKAGFKGPGARVGRVHKGSTVSHKPISSIVRGPKVKAPSLSPPKTPTKAPVKVQAKIQAKAPEKRSPEAPKRAPVRIRFDFREAGPKVQKTIKPGHQQGVGIAPPNWTEKEQPESNIDLIWNGVIHGVSGYAKANREVIKRLDSTLKIRFSPEMLFVDSSADEVTKEMWRNHKKERILHEVPAISFSPPKVEKPAAHRIIYTMMETETVHPNMIQVMNGNYKECWTPTNWNAQTFRRAGLTLPIKIIPLGVDPEIYTPGLQGKIPESTLLTTKDAGKVGIPSGFIFVYVFQPSFRKGVEFLISSFEAAFNRNPDVTLLLGTTAYSFGKAHYLPNPKLKSRIWGLSGKLTEYGLAAMYRACHAYVCTSKGEGWNLPLCEAAACGLPIIAPRTSAHTEIMPPEYGYFFDADGYNAVRDSKAVSPWFDGMLFADYGATSSKTLIHQMQTVVKNYEAARTLGMSYSVYMRSKYTWSSTARLIHDRIKSLF